MGASSWGRWARRPTPTRPTHTGTTTSTSIFPDVMENYGRDPVTNEPDWDIIPDMRAREEIATVTEYRPGLVAG